MKKIIVAAVILVPLSASAFGFSFGGRLLSVPLPCLEIPGSYGIVIFPAGLFAPTYVYTPLFTIGLPPTHPGQQILGIADIPLTCNGVPAFRIQLNGIGV